MIDLRNDRQHVKNKNFCSFSTLVDWFLAPELF